MEEKNKDTHLNFDGDLIKYLLSKGGFDKGTDSWIELSKRFNVAPHHPDTPEGWRRRANAALKRWKRFLGTERGLELKKALIDKDGNVVNFRIGRAEEPKELPDTTGLELKFVTTTPGGGAFVRHEKPAQKRLSADDIREIVKEVSDVPISKKEWKPKALKGYSQILSLGDVHIGMAAEDNIFNLKWNRKILFKRADKLLEQIDEKAKEVVFVFGGDMADGLKGMTNRGGHKLPQNMSDKEQLRTSKDFVLYLFDNAVRITKAGIKAYFVTNSNHPGIIDFATAEIVGAVVPNRYKGQVQFNVEESFFGHFRVNNTDHIFTHGYDEDKMLRGMPRFLRPKDIELVEKYMDHKNIKRAYLWRYDQHQSSKVVYSKFIDIMTPAFSNPSSWVALNFAADYKGGFVSAEISESGEMKYRLIEF